MTGDPILIYGWMGGDGWIGGQKAWTGANPPKRLDWGGKEGTGNHPFGADSSRPKQYLVTPVTR